jgi:hypothetical protein
VAWARKLGEPRIVAPVTLSMIARLNRIGERCRSALHVTCLLTRVLFVALRGLYRSWRAHDPTAHATFRRARHATYRQLWTMLEDVYWKLRARNTDLPTVRALLSDVNAYVGENVLYIREADQVLLSQYILSLQRLRAARRPMSENDAVAVWQDICGRMPGTVADIDGVVQEAVGLRNRVLLQLRRALPAN